MEQNIKQHTLTFEQGITSVPSDITSPDNALAEADGIVYLDGEYKPLQNPKDAQLSSGSYTLALIHLLNSGDKNKLYYNGDNTTGSASLIWSATTLASNVFDVKSIGNTIIANTTNGIYYFLWNGYSYTPLGNKIPEPVVSVSFDSSTDTFRSSVKMGGIVKAYETEKSTDHANMIWAQADEQVNFENACVGAYSELKNKIKEANSFVNPFFLRYALELYDGSYTYISNPILMHTFFGKNLVWELNNYEDKGDWVPDTMTIELKALSLLVSQSTDYSDYSDIVRGVTLFITDPVDRYITNHNDVTVQTEGYKQWDSFEQQNISGNIYYDANNNSYSETYSSDKKHKLYRLLSRKSDADIVKELKESSVFYKLCDLGEKSISNVKASSLFTGKILKNITTQQQLDHDDYYSHTQLKPTNMFTFNRRLNITGASRTFFNGFTSFTNIKKGTSAKRTIYVRIKTSSGNRIVSTEVTSTDPIEGGYWFFYPDTRADHIWIVKGGSCVLSTSLMEHPYLNGAYYFNSIPDDNYSLTIPSSASDSPGTVSNSPERLSNYLLQSEVDNPFTFFASGYVRVGQGTILGMAGLTTALSQDAYKISTTLVFTTQGIWALKINDQGQYTSVAPPFSREVCTFPETITMTDNAVFFVSKKGLMCVTGESESSVVCVSKNLKDSAFVSYCNSSLCRIAYDYKERLLYVMQIGSEDAYIYSISSGTWTYDSDIFGNMNGLLTVVTDYPDSYIQSEGYSVRSLLSRPNRNNDTTRYSGYFTSRPLKLSGSLIPESIRRIKHLIHPDIKVFTSQSDYNGATSTTSSLLLTIKGSNDLTTWSDPLTSTGGKPYRFFKFQYTFKNFLAIHTFAATILLTQQRHTNRFI